MNTILRSLLGALAVLSAPLANAAEVTVMLRNFEFVPNDVTIQVGDTVNFVNQGGFHDVRADNGSFSRPASASNWTLSQQFTAAGEVLVHCSIHSSPGVSINSGMNGRINVVSQPAGFTINQGIAGAWFNPTTSGQGILFDIDPATQFLFGAIFTYDVAAAMKLGAPEHRWLTVQGTYQGNQAQIPIFQTSGGVFDQPVPTDTVAIGNATITFESCTSASLGYELIDPPLSGTIPLVRVIPGTETLCQQLAVGSGAVETSD